MLRFGTATFAVILLSIATLYGADSGDIPVLAASLAAETGKLQGPNPSSTSCHPTGVVWAQTPSCRIAYRTTIDWNNGFVFEALPVGTYKVMAVCESQEGILGWPLPKEI